MSIFIAITRRTLIATTGVLIFSFLIFNLFEEDVIRRTFFGSEFFLFFILGILVFYFFSGGFLNLPPVFLIFIVVVSYLLMGIVQSKGLMVDIESGNVVGGRLLLYGVPAFFLVLASVGLEGYLVRLRGVFSFLISTGDASYAIYLTHWFVIVFSRKVLSERLGLYDFYSLSGALITLFFTLIIGHVVYYFIDRHMYHKLRNFLRFRLLKEVCQD